MRPSDPPAETGLLTGSRDAAAATRRARGWDQLAEDLASLGSELQRDVAGLSTRDGEVESLCPGWTVRDVVVHLAVGDDLAVRALAGEDCFPAPTVDESVLARESRERVAEWGAVPVDEAVARFVRGRRRLLQAVTELPTDGRRGRVPWAARPISRLSLVQSRLMETWVHGRDLRLPLDLPSPYDDRCWWVNDLGVRHVPYALAKAGLDLDVGVDLVLEGPGGGEWRSVLGAATGEQVTISGPSWAWLVAVAQRVPGREGALARLVGPVAADPVLETARAYA